MLFVMFKILQGSTKVTEYLQSTGFSLRRDGMAVNKNSHVSLCSSQTKDIGMPKSAHEELGIWVFGTEQYFFSNCPGLPPLPSPHSDNSQELSEKTEKARLYKWACRKAYGAFF